MVAKRTITRALDAGCGTGYFAKLVEQRYEIPTIAIDYGWDGLQFGRKLGQPRLAQCDVCALPFPAESFELVLSMDVIAHLPRGGEAAALREMVRVMAGGGLIAIRVSALDILRSRHTQFAHERQRFTRSRLIEAAQAAGLGVLRCTYANSLLAPVALAKFRVWEPLTNQPPASGVGPVPAWLDRVLYAPLAIESHLTRVGLNLPAGQSLVLIAEKKPS